MGTIADKLAYTKQARSEIVEAIVAKGVMCPSTAPFCSFDEYIAQISGGGGQALPSVYNYILDDIVLLLDAIDNSFDYYGHAHSNTTPIWQDKSLLNHNGVITNATWNNNKLSFNGNAWVNCGRLDLPYLTLEVLARYNTVESGETNYIVGNAQSGGYGICQQDKKYSCFINVNGTYYMLYGSSVDTSQVVHQAMTYDGSVFKFYQNGIEVDSKSVSGTIRNPSNGTVLAIGANPDGTSATQAFLKGDVYAVRVYSSTLSAEDIFNNYQMDVQRFSL